MPGVGAPDTPPQLRSAARAPPKPWLSALPPASLPRDPEREPTARAGGRRQASPSGHDSVQLQVPVQASGLPASCPDKQPPPQTPAQVALLCRAQYGPKGHLAEKGLVSHLAESPPPGLGAGDREPERPLQGEAALGTSGRDWRGGGRCPAETPSS